MEEFPTMGSKQISISAFSTLPYQRLCWPVFQQSGCKQNCEMLHNHKHVSALQVFADNEVSEKSDKVYSWVTGCQLGPGQPGMKMQSSKARKPWSSHAFTCRCARLERRAEASLCWLEPKRYMRGLWVSLECRNKIFPASWAFGETKLCSKLTHTDFA